MSTLEARIARILGYEQRGYEYLGQCVDCADPKAWMDAHGHVCDGCGVRSLQEMFDHLGLWDDDARPPGPAEPSPLPPDALPDVLRDLVRSVSESLQAPPDLAAILSLAAGAAAIADRVDVEVRPGQREPLALYVAGIAEPGERKSPVYARICRPLYDWQRRRAAAEEPRRRAALDRVEVLQQQLNRLKAKAAKAEDGWDEMEDARRALDEAERKVPASASLILDDVTPEKLAVELAAQGGRAALFSAEGDVLRIFAGRYGNGDPRADLLKKAINGEPTKISRVTRESIWLPRPILTVGLMFQPSVLGSLGNRQSLEGEGVFARFLFVQPPSALGSRLTGRDVPRPDGAAERRYRRAMERLLDVPPAEVGEDGQRVPNVVELGEEAAEVLFRWESEIERRLALGGDLRGISGWGAKLFGHTCRIAAILELLGRADRDEPLPGGAVGAEAAEQAVALGRALATHALKVLGDLSLDEEVADLLYVWRKCLELDAAPPDDGLTPATLRRATQGRRSLGGADGLEKHLTELMRRGLIRFQEQPPTGGRPKAPRILIHPAFRSAESAERRQVEEPPALSALSAPPVEAREPAVVYTGDPLDVLEEQS